MIDTFALLLTHGCLIVMLYRLIVRPDTDEGAPPPAPRARRPRFARTR